MADVQLRPMSEAGFEAWRARRLEEEDARSALPEPGDGESQVPLDIVADDEPIGAVLLFCAETDGVARCSVRALETSLPSSDIQTWADVLTAVADHARSTGAAAVTGSVPPRLVPVFERAGYRPVSTGHGKRLEGQATGFQDDRRVAVRPMDDAERRAFAAGVGATLEAVLPEPGLLTPRGTLDLAGRIARLGEDPAPDDELLVTATVDDAVVGRAWGTLVERAGARDFYGNVMEIDPDHRGRGLLRSLIGALARHLREIGVRDVHLWVGGSDERTRDTFLEAGVGIDHVHLHRDLDD